MQGDLLRSPPARLPGCGQCRGGAAGRPWRGPAPHPLSNPRTALLACPGLAALPGEAGAALGVSWAQNRCNGRNWYFWVVKLDKDLSPDKGEGTV